MDRPEDTTVILERIAPGFAWLPRVLRKHLTPKAVWSVTLGLWTLVAFFGGSWITGYFHTVADGKDISQLKEHAKRFDANASALQAIAMQLAVLNSKVDNISTEVDHQREWREQIEQQAEAPPHGRWRRK